METPAGPEQPAQPDGPPAGYPIQDGARHRPLTALAPMQDVTDRPFMQILGRMGPPDLLVTEYFRVTETSILEPHILESILDHGTGRPILAQLIGENCEHLARTAKELARYPIDGIDLNMGCPAPKIYRKNVGGGLLRDPEDARRILGTLREASPNRFTVKMRIGFEDDRHFEAILELVNEFGVDGIAIHGRTVKQMYRGEVDYERIAKAVRWVNCPVLANGNITSPEVASAVLRQTGARGVMIGRSAIRNPWIFRQTHQYLTGEALTYPTLHDVRGYMDDLWTATGKPNQPERSHLNRMKKFLAFVGQGVDPEGAFLYRVRRATEPAEFFKICDEFLLNRPEIFSGLPFGNVVARPNHE